jgi:hypothetical protein
LLRRYARQCKTRPTAATFAGERSDRRCPPRPVPLGEPIPFPAHAETKAQTNVAIMCPEEASAILRVTLGADWATIEKSRREIVQKSHPDKVRSLPPERRTALIEHAGRANKAVQVLLGSRTQQNGTTAPLPVAAEASRERVDSRLDSLSSSQMRPQ